MVNEGLNFDMNEIMGFVQSYAQDFSISRVIGSPSKVLRNFLWRPPTIGTIKLNFDTSFMDSTNVSIARVLATDREGQIVGACTYPSMDVANAFAAEARACERALYFALDMGFKKLILEGDSLTNIKNLNSNKMDRSIFRPISQSIWLLERHFEEIACHFVPRDVNRAAHALAMNGRYRHTPCF
ncbi:uncharacterized protein [Gossypium hirsutum]|uniref:RNase H type-1 domain-containing protein n=1 Tax=Gossypium hirsutum TaxID=3635 RepID=A0A1U8IJF3_GOSHI|nr:uncharacterized protein LOC107895773 [Gossypium hirsutum]